MLMCVFDIGVFVVIIFVVSESSNWKWKFICLCSICVNYFMWLVEGFIIFVFFMVIVKF